MKKLLLLLPMLLFLHGCGDVEWLPDAARPAHFSFAGKSEVATGTTVTSEAVTVTGNMAPAMITVVNGEYAIGGTGGDGQFTSKPGKVSAGQTITVRHTSSADHDTAVSTVVNIEGVTAVFTSVTRPLSDATGTFVLTAALQFESDATSADVSFELRNTSLTTAYLGRVDFVGMDAAGKVVYSGSGESPLPYEPGETAIFVAPVTLTATEQSSIVKWKATAITRVETGAGTP